MFIAAQFTIAKCWMQPKCPSVNEWIKKTGTFTRWNTTRQKEKEGAPTLCDSMDGTAGFSLSIMLSEIIQAVKDKYHMISPVSGT